MWYHQLSSSGYRGYPVPSCDSQVFCRFLCKDDLRTANVFRIMAFFVSPHRELQSGEFLLKEMHSSDWSNLLVPISRYTAHSSIQLKFQASIWCLPCSTSYHHHHSWWIAMTVTSNTSSSLFSAFTCDPTNTWEDTHVQLPDGQLLNYEKNIFSMVICSTEAYKV